MCCILGAFQAFASATQVTSGTEGKVVALLRMKANKKLVQQEISKETGKVILLKDICNIITAVKQGRSRNNLDITVQTSKINMACTYFMS